METTNVGLSIDGSNSNNGSLEKTVKKVSYWIGGTALIALAITLFFYMRSFHGGISLEHKEWAEFGDYLGGTLNPVFSLLSLLAILVTLIYQAKELYSSTMALKEQANYSKLQAFESTFFSMVMMHNENLKSLDLDETEEQKHSGRAVFRIMHRRFRDSYADCEGSNELQKIKESYDKFYNKNSRFIGHYLRTLNQIFEFIFNSNVENKEKYLLFISAQLSEYELMIIFYHSMARNNFVSMKLLKDSYVFQDFIFETLVNIEAHKAYLVEGE